MSIPEKYNLEHLFRLVAKHNASGEFGQDCPDPTLLAAYWEKLLSKEKSDWIEAHLSHCSNCREWLMELTATSHAVENTPRRMPSRLMEKILKQHGSEGGSNRVIQLLYSARQNLLSILEGTGIFLNLQPVMQRGRQIGCSCLVHLSEWEVEISTDRQMDGHYEAWFRVQPDRIGSRRCEWQVWMGEQLQEQQPAERGEVLFTDLPTGLYRFVLIVSGQEIGAVQLTFEDGDEENGQSEVLGNG